MYLDEKSLPRFAECSMRTFNKIEYHVTRTFRYNVLILMLGGILRFRESGKDIELRKGEFYIQRAGLFQEGVVPSESAKYFYIHFEAVFSEKGSVPICGTFDIVELSPFITSLERAYFSPNASIFSLNAEFYGILKRLETKTATNEFGLAHKVVGYISENFCRQKFGVKDIALHFGYSQDYIIRLFKKEFSCTPHSYITSLRIQQAKQLMIYSDKSLSEISVRCGYEDYSVFYKNFIKSASASPEMWLKNKRL